MLPIDDGAPRARDQHPSRSLCYDPRLHFCKYGLPPEAAFTPSALFFCEIYNKTRQTVLAGDAKVHPALQEPDPLCNATSGCFFLSSAHKFEQFKKRYYRIDGLQENEERNDEPTGRKTPLYPTRFGAVCSDGSVRVFDLEAKSFDEVLWWDKRLQNVYDADVSRDGTLLFVMNIYGVADRFEEELCVYNLATGEELWEFVVDYQRGAQLVDPFENYDDCAYGEYLVASDDAGLVSDNDGGTTTFRMRGKLITSGADRKVVNTDSVSTTRLVRPQVNKAFDQMVTTNHEEDSCLILWDLNTGTETRRYNGIHAKGICCARFTRDGLHCLTGSVDKTAAITNLSTGYRASDTANMLRRCISVPGRFQDRPRQKWNNKSLSRKREDAPACRWTVMGPVLVICETTQRFVGHQDVVHLAALSPDEDTLATGSYDKTVRIWDVATGVVLHMIADPYSAPSCILFQHPAWLLTCSTHGDAMGINIKDGMKVRWYVGLHRLLLPFGPGRELVRMRPLMLPAAFDGRPSSSLTVLAFSSMGNVTLLDLSARQLPLDQYFIQADQCVDGIPARSTSS
ncbi:hypothetical protein VOLCADRAFT_100565 [Volvox carteri f. nagariensis]|uniref:Uncharacterized protein n=1 Tax=Volvox carteri f. nagariensis TaxID=3068 RepID=D8UKI0_VOLCA|nr:uncharacterized protein VOLCADRAFT_100565 [Volvox carteri f. nagariensis]EFJ39761.1 hypothetical protein VOLCADRAFT_100565 [Volvox carteri f. nagariensis]|eukprot:XP_002959171.1 hypothetical protein VOLCADRAFT_100565 [Volvox carteri f. nagariensis]